MKQAKEIHILEDANVVDAYEDMGNGVWIEMQDPSQLSPILSRTW